MSEPTIISMGCRLNAFEADIIAANATAAGLDDCIVVNTCAVTAESVRQAAQSIRRLRRERPAARIIVTGCAAQLDPERFAAMADVDHVIGNREKLDAHVFAELKRTDRGTVVSDISQARRLSLPSAATHTSRTRAYVAVQNGCDHRCTFCIIPFARGPSRSVPADDVVRHIADLVEAGYSEAVLTGVDLTSYGGDLPGDAKLGRLVRQILKQVPELPRLRLSSIDQVEVDRDLMDALATEDRLMPHLHLSMQSGDDIILKRMKRRHSRDDAIRFCETARRLRPNVVFGADLIAGFPTETDGMFAATLEAIEACGLTYLHVFPYSARAGTPAARMPQVPLPVIKARAEVLRRTGAETLAAFLEAHCDRDVEVLMEKNGVGRTDQFAEVKVSDGPTAGAFARVRISGHDGRRMHGKVAA